MERSHSGLNALLAFLAAFVFVTYGLPFLALVGMVLNLQSLHELGDLFQSYRLSCFWASARRALLVSIASVLLGFLIAVVAQKLLPRWRTRVLVLFTLPFLASDVCRAFALRVTLGRHGLVNDALIFLGLTSEPVDWLLFSEFAIVLGQFVNTFPFALFPLAIAVSSIDPRLYQVADELGARGFHRFRKVIAPLSFPAVIGSFLVTFAIGLGAMVEVDFLSYARCSIGHTITGLWLARRPELAAAGSLLVWLVSFVLLCGALGVFRRSPIWSVSMEPKLEEQMIRRRSTWDRASLALGIMCLATVLALVLIPPTLLIWFSINPRELGIPSERFGFRWYSVALLDERIQSALCHSFYVAAFSTVAATVLAFVASIIFVRRVHLGLLFLLLGLPIFVPGRVHGLALSNMARSIGLGGSDYLLIIAHSAFVLPYCSAILLISLANFPRSLLDIAMELGASKVYTIRRVFLPHARRGIVASVCVGFLMSLNECARSFYLTSEDLLCTYVYGKMLGGADPSVYAVGSILYIMALVGLFVVLTMQSGSSVE